MRKHTRHVQDTCLNCFSSTLQAVCAKLGLVPNVDMLEYCDDNSPAVLQVSLYPIKNVFVY